MAVVLTILQIDLCLQKMTMKDPTLRKVLNDRCPLQEVAFHPIQDLILNRLMLFSWGRSQNATIRILRTTIILHKKNSVKLYYLLYPCFHFRYHCDVTRPQSCAITIKEEKQNMKKKSMLNNSCINCDIYINSIEKVHNNWKKKEASPNLRYRERLRAQKNAQQYSCTITFQFMLRSLNTTIHEWK